MDKGRGQREAITQGKELPPVDDGRESDEDENITLSGCRASLLTDLFASRRIIL